LSAEPFAQLADLVATAPAEQLPDIVGRLAAEQARALARIASSHPAPVRALPPEDEWITPEQAATIARVPKRRLYQWATGQRWAHRPSRKTLRISRRSFERWLASRA
jgi:hypothetical protein